jgi:hypothetical protein
MARDQGIPASHALGKDRLQHWFGTQPREVALTLSCRAGLRALPLLVPLWGRPNFQVLPFFRAAQSAWTYAKYPGLAARALGRASLETLSENSYAGVALMLAEATPLPRARNNTSEFAARAIVSAIHDETLADPSLEEVMAVEAAGEFSARGAFAVALAGRPLWREIEIPNHIALSWRELRAALRAESDTGWGDWIEWYEDRLAGRPSLGEAFDIAVATLPNALWEQGPTVVNARIEELIAEHTQSEPIPAQGAGPHFALNLDLKIALAPPTEIDAEGNNLGRIRQLLPQVRQAAGDLAGHVSPNSQPEINRNLAQYREAIAAEPQTITWGTVFGLGIRLENAAAAAQRDIANRLHEPLEDAAQEALDSLLTLHGPLILATAEGRELLEQAARLRLTANQEDVLREDARELAQYFANLPERIDASVAQAAFIAAEATADGPHPERGFAYWLQTIGNVATILLPAATLASFVPFGFALGGTAGGVIGGGLAWSGYEVFKKTGLYSSATAALGPEFNRLLEVGRKRGALTLLRLVPFRDFVLRHEQPLRRIAETAGSHWMAQYIDLIIRTNLPKE